VEDNDFKTYFCLKYVSVLTLKWVLLALLIPYLKALSTI